MAFFIGRAVFRFIIKVDNVQVAKELGDAAVRVTQELGSNSLKLCTIWVAYKLLQIPIDAAVKNTFDVPRDDQEIPEIKPGCLHVLLRCLTDKRFLEVLEDYELGKIKQRLQKELSQVGFEVEGLTIEIENMEEVNKTKAAINERMSYPTEAMTESEEKKTKKTDSIVSDESELSSGNNQELFQGGMTRLSMQVHAGIVSGINTGKNVEKKMQQKNFPGAEESLQGLLMGLGETEKKTKEMVDEAKRFEKIIYDNQSNFERLQADFCKMHGTSEKKNEYLENKIKELITVNRNLEMRQTAYDFENLLATHMYQRARCTPAIFSPIFPKLMLWLDENKIAPEGNEANKVWAEFKDQVRWSDEHEKVLHKILDSESTVSDDDNQYVEEIRKMIELLKMYNP